MTLARMALMAGIFAISTLVQSQPGDPQQAWARVLHRFVSATGAVDFRALSRERADLDTFVGHVAHISPRSAPALFSGKEAALAYYINAYNAVAMFNVIDSGFPESLGSWRKVLFFAVKVFPVGGEWMSLYALENDVIRPLGDERVHFALNCMVVGCPRLPRAVFHPDTLERQLEDEARRFFSESRNLQVLTDRKLVRVSAILQFYTEDFLARSPTLIAYINRYAPVEIPADFAIEFIDYDWTVNDLHRDAGASASP